MCACHSAGARRSLARAVFVGSLLSSIGVGAVVGNALVVLSVLTNPKLRTITNRFVASLACADFSVGVLVMPLAVKVTQEARRRASVELLVKLT